MIQSFEKKYSREISVLINQSSDEDIIEALYIIGNSGKRKSEQFLIKFLGHENVYVKIISIQALTKSGSSGGEEKLPKLLGETESSSFFSNLVDYAIRINARNVEKQILAKLNSENSMIQYDAIRAIRKMKIYSSIPLLTLLIKEEKRPENFNENGELISFVGKSIGEAALEALQVLEG